MAWAIVILRLYSLSIAHLKAYNNNHDVCWLESVMKKMTNNQIEQLENNILYIYILKYIASCPNVQRFLTCTKEQHCISPPLPLHERIYTSSICKIEQDKYIQKGIESTQTIPAPPPAGGT